ncbi:MAG: prepilin peptidase [Lachnospiraceae bacterium]|nr:prepilin peptidase [Lachnospiraceae bacterium]MCR5411205.1 prepilin peptidase [Lachnospiraceae bacterium]
MMDTVRTVSFFVFLIAGTVFDIRKRRIPLILLLAAGAWGILSYTICTGWTGSDLWDEIFGLLIGAVFIGISLISEGKMGMGDAIAILVGGIYLGGSGSAFAVLYSLIIAAAVSAVILVLKRGSGKSELPFMPFLLAGCVIGQIM